MTAPRIGVRTIDVPTIDVRTRATVAGLCAGDAISWPAWWHRLAQLPPRRGVRLSEAWQHDRDMAATSLPTPYLQSSPPSLVDPAGPTDDTEWFVVAVRHHLGQRLDGSPAPHGPDVWTELAEQRAADQDSVRARVGTVIALHNLARGSGPPTSGNDNPHYFDDIACVRGVAAGLLRPGAPAAAAELAEQDAIVTHALDGVYGARATAALVSVLVSGGERVPAITAALRELPVDSWCAHVVAECLGAIAAGDRPLGLAARLERDVVDHVYAYANQAPETLGLLLAHLSTAEDGQSLLLGALAHPRHADTLVPLAGAVAGAAFADVPDQGPLPTASGACVRALTQLPLEGVLADIAAHRDRPERDVGRSVGVESPR